MSERRRGHALLDTKRFAEEKLTARNYRAKKHSLLHVGNSERTLSSLPSHMMLLTGEKEEKDEKKHKPYTDSLSGPAGCKLTTEYNVFLHSSCTDALLEKLDAGKNQD